MRNPGYEDNDCYLLALRRVEWVDFKSTFLEKYKCHDHKTDILRSLSQFQFKYV